MFGFGKKKPLIEGPIEFEIEVEINRLARDVYRLIDVSDPGFAHIARGSKVAPVAGTEDRYTMIMPEMEDLTFHFHVLSRVEGKSHSLECVIDPLIGNLRKTVESHVIEPLDDNACLVRLKVEATFADDLSDVEVAQEVAIMSISVENDLTKLAIHAEEGVEAVKAFDAEQYGDC